MLQQSAEVFNSQESTKEEIEKAGDKAVVHLYGGNEQDTLDTLRHKKFNEKVASRSSFIEPQSLPPTSAAAKYHSYRVFYQVCMWKSRDINLLPEDWGWCKRNAIMFPIQTDLPPAPDDLLKVIRCCCQTECNSQRCNCRKHNLKCTQACGKCRGSDCSNGSVSQVDEEESDDED